MPSWERRTASAEETIRLGAELATWLRPPILVMLTGDLGSGKTTLTKGIVSGLGASRPEDVTSPTFTLVHIFHNHCTVYHVDLYRLSRVTELESIGLEDVLAEPAVVVVEWAEKLALRTDWPVVRVHLEQRGDDERTVRIQDESGALAVPAGERN
jgi:tRNA threonylcarbamoyladenosine biosynthesis protein TsaE